MARLIQGRGISQRPKKNLWDASGLARVEAVISKRTTLAPPPIIVESPPKPTIIEAIAPPTIGDRRFKQWQKVVTGVDTSKKGGFMYEGEFISQTRDDFKVGTIVISYGMEGSRKVQGHVAKVSRLSSDGEWVTLDYSRGISWAIDLRTATRKALGT